MCLHDKNKVARLERKIERLEAALRAIIDYDNCGGESPVIIADIAREALEDTKP